MFLSPIFSLTSRAHRPENSPSIYMNLQEGNFPEDFSPIAEDFNLKYFLMMTRKASLKVFKVPADGSKIIHSKLPPQSMSSFAKETVNYVNQKCSSCQSVLHLYPNKLVVS